MSFFKKLFGSNENKNPEKEAKQKSDVGANEEVSWMTDVRRETLSICYTAGYKPVKNLPTDLGRQLRPSIEIANRLHAIKALVLWLMVPEEHLPNDKLLNFVDQNNLKQYMTEDEKAILTVDRDDAEARNAIGWKFENAWPLAWYFGYVEPDIMGQMMSGDQMQEILTKHTCPLKERIEDWIKSKETVPENELLKKEDLFYCLHNAVRSAQLGGDTVPAGFDPIGNGGVIHERRHSLTWMLSKDVAWNDTDLST